MKGTIRISIFIFISLYTITLQTEELPRHIQKVNDLAHTIAHTGPSATKADQFQKSINELHAPTDCKIELDLQLKHFKQKTEYSEYKTFENAEQIITKIIALQTMGKTEFADKLYKQYARHITIAYNNFGAKHGFILPERIQKYIKREMPIFKQEVAAQKTEDEQINATYIINFIENYITANVAPEEAKHPINLENLVNFMQLLLHEQDILYATLEKTNTNLTQLTEKLQTLKSEHAKSMQAKEVKDTIGWLIEQLLNTFTTFQKVVNEALLKDDIQVLSQLNDLFTHTTQKRAFSNSMLDLVDHAIKLSDFTHPYIWEQLAVNKNDYLEHIRTLSSDVLYFYTEAQSEQKVAMLSEQTKQLITSMQQRVEQKKGNERVKQIAQEIETLSTLELRLLGPEKIEVNFKTLADSVTEVLKQSRTNSEIVKPFITLLNTLPEYFIALNAALKPFKSTETDRPNIRNTIKTLFTYILAAFDALEKTATMIKDDIGENPQPLEKEQLAYYIDELGYALITLNKSMQKELFEWIPEVRRAYNSKLFNVHEQKHKKAYATILFDLITSLHQEASSILTEMMLKEQKELEKEKERLAPLHTLQKQFEETNKKLQKAIQNKDENTIEKVLGELTILQENLRTDVEDLGKQLAEKNEPLFIHAQTQAKTILGEEQVQNTIDRYKKLYEVEQFSDIIKTLPSEEKLPEFIKTLTDLRDDYENIKELIPKEKRETIIKQIDTRLAQEEEILKNSIAEAQEIIESLYETYKDIELAEVSKIITNLERDLLSKLEEKIEGKIQYPQLGQVFINMYHEMGAYSTDVKKKKNNIIKKLSEFIDENDLALLQSTIEKQYRPENKESQQQFESIINDIIKNINQLDATLTDLTSLKTHTKAFPKDVSNKVEEYISYVLIAFDTLEIKTYQFLQKLLEIEKQLASFAKSEEYQLLIQNYQIYTIALQEKPIPEQIQTILTQMGLTDEEKIKKALENVMQQLASVEGLQTLVSTMSEHLEALKESYHVAYRLAVLVEKVEPFIMYTSSEFQQGLKQKTRKYTDQAARKRAAQIETEINNLINRRILKAAEHTIQAQVAEYKEEFPGYKKTDFYVKAVEEFPSYKETDFYVKAVNDALKDFEKNTELYQLHKQIANSVQSGLGILPNRFDDIQKELTILLTKLLSPIEPELNLSGNVLGYLERNVTPENYNELIQKKLERTFGYLLAAYDALISKTYKRITTEKRDNKLYNNLLLHLKTIGIPLVQLIEHYYEHLKPYVSTSFLEELKDGRMNNLRLTQIALPHGERGISIYPYLWEKPKFDKYHHKTVIIQGKETIQTYQELLQNIINNFEENLKISAEKRTKIESQQPIGDLSFEEIAQNTQTSIEQVKTFNNIVREFKSKASFNNLHKEVTEAIIKTKDISPRLTAINEQLHTFIENVSDINNPALYKQYKDFLQKEFGYVLVAYDALMKKYIEKVTAAQEPTSWTRWGLSFIPMAQQGLLVLDKLELENMLNSFQTIGIPLVKIIAHYYNFFNDSFDKDFVYRFGTGTLNVMKLTHISDPENPNTYPYTHDPLYDEFHYKKRITEEEKDTLWTYEKFLQHAINDFQTALNTPEKDMTNIEVQLQYPEIKREEIEPLYQQPPVKGSLQDLADITKEIGQVPVTEEPVTSVVKQVMEEIKQPKIPEITEPFIPSETLEQEPTVEEELPVEPEKEDHTQLALQKVQNIKQEINQIQKITQEHVNQFTQRLNAIQNLDQQGQTEKERTTTLLNNKLKESKKREDNNKRIQTLNSHINELQNKTTDLKSMHAAKDATAAEQKYKVIKNTDISKTLEDFDTELLPARILRAQRTKLTEALEAYFNQVVIILLRDVEIEEDEPLLQWHEEVKDMPWSLSKHWNSYSYNELIQKTLLRQLTLAAKHGFNLHLEQLNSVLAAYCAIFDACMFGLYKQDFSNWDENIKQEFINEKLPEIQTIFTSDKPFINEFVEQFGTYLIQDTKQAFETESLDIATMLPGLKNEDGSYIYATQEGQTFEVKKDTIVNVIPIDALHKKDYANIIEQWKTVLETYDTVSALKMLANADLSQFTGKELDAKLEELETIKDQLSNEEYKTIKNVLKKRKQELIHSLEKIYKEFETKIIEAKTKIEQYEELKKQGKTIITDINFKEPYTEFTQLLKDMSKNSELEKKQSQMFTLFIGYLTECITYLFNSSNLQTLHTAVFKGDDAALIYNTQEATLIANMIEQTREFDINIDTNDFDKAFKRIFAYVLAPYDALAARLFDAEKENKQINEKKIIQLNDILIDLIHTFVTLFITPSEKGLNSFIQKRYEEKKIMLPVLFELKDLKNDKGAYKYKRNTNVTNKHKKEYKNILKKPLSVTYEDAYKNLNNLLSLKKYYFKSNDIVVEFIKNFMDFEFTNATEKESALILNTFSLIAFLRSIHKSIHNLKTITYVKDKDYFTMKEGIEEEINELNNKIDSFKDADYDTLYEFKIDKKEDPVKLSKETLEAYHTQFKEEFDQVD